VASRAMVKPIYKILSEGDYKAAKSRGQFLGSSDDLHDGFIHFSAGHQVAETLAKHYASQADLVLLSVDPHQLGPALKWERSRNGDLFPHLYGPLALDAVVAETLLALDEDNRHILPEGIA
jgi:uncharacterized protein (DUF952 family)